MARRPSSVSDPDDAWRPWKPSRSQPWHARWAAHLYRRAAFGADWTTIQTAVERGPDDTLERLLSGSDGFEEFEQRARHDASKLVDRPLRDTVELEGRWMDRMLRSPHPLLEKLTLFWHNHFATNVAKVGSARLMQRQNELLRRSALGKFGTLLSAVSRDPAMLIWLDSKDNVKGKPNENYAREIMEAFTLGAGNFTERDVQEVARTFTGWRSTAGEFTLDEDKHDFGVKTVLGETGAWDGDDVVRILLDQPAAARFLARKLYRFFVSEADDPPSALIEPLADMLRQSKYDVGQVVAVVLRSRLFFSERAYRQRVKSPVEFVLGMINHLRTDGLDVTPFGLAKQVTGLGQRLYSPPSVFGWEGGTAWLSSGQLLARHNLAFEFTSSPFRSDNPADLVAQHGGERSTQHVDFLIALLLDGVVGPNHRKRLVEFLDDGVDSMKVQRLREVTHLVMLLPEYQLA
jgi:uncharacterized protein (DUF1800 family)